MLITLPRLYYYDKNANVAKEFKELVRNAALDTKGMLARQQLFEVLHEQYGTYLSDFLAAMCSTTPAVYSDVIAESIVAEMSQVYLGKPLYQHGMDY